MNGLTTIPGDRLEEAMEKDSDDWTPEEILRETFSRPAARGQEIKNFLFELSNRILAQASSTEGSAIEVTHLSQKQGA